MLAGGEGCSWRDYFSERVYTIAEAIAKGAERMTRKKVNCRVSRISNFIWYSAAGYWAAFLPCVTFPPCFYVWQARICIYLFSTPFSFLSFEKEAKYYHGSGRVTDVQMNYFTLKRVLFWENVPTLSAFFESPLPEKVKNLDSSHYNLEFEAWLTCSLKRCCLSIISVGVSFYVYRGYVAYTLKPMKEKTPIVRLSPCEIDAGLHAALETLRWEKRKTWKALVNEALAAWLQANQNNGGAEI